MSVDTGSETDPDMPEAISDQPSAILFPPTPINSIDIQYASYPDVNINFDILVPTRADAEHSQ